MSFLPDGHIVMVREPVDFRAGLRRLSMRLQANYWKTDLYRNNGPEFTAVLFNKSRTQCRIIKLGRFNRLMTVAELNEGRFQVPLDKDGKLVPEPITRSELERLLLDGTTHGAFRSAAAQKAWERAQRNRLQVA